MYDVAQDQCLLRKRHSLSVKNRSHSKRLLATNCPRTENLRGAWHTGAPENGIYCQKLPLDTVSTYKYLGITLDSHLNYNKHVQKVISSVSGKLKQFQRMCSFLNVRAALAVYKSTILPLLEYNFNLIHCLSNYQLQHQF